MTENDILKIHRTLIMVVSEYGSFLEDHERDQIKEALEITVKGMKTAEKSEEPLGKPPKPPSKRKVNEDVKLRRRNKR